MRTIVLFTLSFILGFNPVFAQSLPIEITPIANGFTISFTLPSYTLRDTALADFYTTEVFKYVKIRDFGHIDDVGYPQLPQFSFDLHLPYGASNFSISSSNRVTQTIVLNRRIVPTQDDFDALPASQPVFQLNQAYYASNGNLYNTSGTLSDSYIVFSEKGITMSIFPFLYNPQTNSLTVVKNVTFTVTWSVSGSIRPLSVPKSGIKSSYLSGFFTNYTQTKSGSQFEGRYLMITAPGLESTLTPFADYKRTLGYEVTVVNTNTSGTSSTAIRNYLYAQYNNANTRPDFVLLVGNTVSIPASAGTSNNIDDPVTDLYYACLDGDDLIADVILGRFPASNATALQNMITKTMYMEQNVHGFGKKAKFLAGREDARKWYDVFRWEKKFMESQFKRGHDYAICNTFDQLGYTSQKLYQPDNLTVKTALNDNPLFFIYSGHGMTTYLAGNSFTVDNAFLSSCTNTVYPLVFSFACHTDNFANANCLGTQWLARSNGGVSYFGSSVSTMSNSDVAIEENIFGDAFIDRDRLGEIVNLGMKRYLGETLL